MQTYPLAGEAQEYGIMIPLALPALVRTRWLVLSILGTLGAINRPIDLTIDLEWGSASHFLVF